MTAEFEERLAGLAHVKNADDRGVRGDRGEKVGVVWGSGDAKEGWWEGDVGARRHVASGSCGGVGAGRVERGCELKFR